ncbi:hypothetical protein BFAG_00827 [Bacteroides fragilis 3_1_12]|uniref:Uncharacterized protein n=1 Tax=Bacteroides fragilis 3_1_12 TaxID=457424 RepID=A0ABN0BGR3_BACFG|nr:hypothetical protein BFAG_00827 [Bacteroides fragilis 3_1_12]
MHYIELKGSKIFSLTSHKTSSFRCVSLMCEGHKLIIKQRTFKNILIYNIIYYNNKFTNYYL